MKLTIQNIPGTLQYLFTKTVNGETQAEVIDGTMSVAEAVKKFDKKIIQLRPEVWREL